MDRRRFLGLAAAAVLVRPAPAGARPGRLALATCDTEARLAVVDLLAGRVVRSIACLPDPRSVERAGPQAVVCHTDAGALSVVDLSTHSVRHVLRGFEEPRYTAAHPDGRHAFVTDSAARTLVAVDVLRGRALGHVELQEWPRHVTVDPAGVALWVGLGSASEHVAVVDVADPARPRLVRTLRPPFLAHDVGYEPSGAGVWVTSGDEDGLAVFDPGARRPRLRLPAGSPPQHVTFAGGLAYVTSGGDGTVRTLSLRDGRALASARVAVGSYNVQAAGGLVLTPSLDDGTLTVLGRDGSVRRRIRVASSSHDACFA